MPAIDRVALLELLAAVTHTRVDVAPIASVIELATHDPWGYVRQHAESLRAYGVAEPVASLPALALFGHVPAAHLMYVDWKASMDDVLDGMVAILAAGPGLAFDATPWRAKVAAWDRRPRIEAALKEIPISGGVLIAVDTGGDSHAIACMPAAAAKRISTWKRKTGLPIKRLTR